jgi:hypothetical protein
MAGMEIEKYGGLTSREFNDMVAALKVWASTHRRQSEPVIMLMGQSFTPQQFVEEVELQTDFGLSFLDYVRRPAAASETTGQFMAPRDFIDRAILANK